MTRPWKIALVVIAVLGLYAGFYHFAKWNERQDLIEAIERGQAVTRTMLDDLGRDIDAVDKQSLITAGFLVRYAESIWRSVRVTEAVNGILGAYPKMKPEALDGILRAAFGGEHE